MKLLFHILAMLSCMGGLSVLIYTHIHEDGYRDYLFNYQKSLFMRDVAIILFNLSIVFTVLADIAP